MNKKQLSVTLYLLANMILKIGYIENNGSRQAVLYSTEENLVKEVPWNSSISDSFRDKKAHDV